ncbi:MAG: sensor histidine kinase [Nitrospirae bacterium]|nr:MAG: sensor histidine kinase [Nitrospirota bacterium]
MGLNLRDKYLNFYSSDDSNLSIKERYLTLSRSFLIIMLLVTIVPLSITTALSYFQYRSLIRQETINNAQWNAESTRQGIESFIDKLRAMIQVVSESYRYKDLSVQENLDKVFENLKSKNKGIVDLSVIGPDGVQQAYSGPFNLKGKDYSDSPWYQKTLTRKVYVSEVFLGYRNVPHFVIAISKKVSGENGYWVLRASIDTDTLDQFLAGVRNENLVDAFLINSKGALQSSSHNYGNVSSQSPVSVERLPKNKDILTVENKQGSKSMVNVVARINESPWFLVLEQYGYADKKTWVLFKRELLVIYVVSFVVIICLTFFIASFLTSTVRKEEETREIILAESEHANKLASIGRLAAGIAHEINNPLAIINEKAGLMKDLLQVSNDFKYKDKFLMQIDAMENAVKRSRTITHRLLGFARRMDIKLEPVDINSVITEVLGFLDKEAAYQEIRIDQDLQPNLPDIMSDHGQLQQIFMNIINNAIDAVGNGGIIQISSRQIDTKTVRVDICDNGPGMPPEVLKKVFEPFFTTKKGSERQGTGLGLSITYGLIKKLGAKISASSEVGIGTTFTILIPIRSVSAEGGTDR